MADAISVLEDQRKKLARKVEKLREQLSAAETELMESETAIRVLHRLGISPTVADADETAKQSSREQVFNVLPTHEVLSLTPTEVHQTLAKEGSIISADNVRTILSRLKKDGEVLVADGRYWRKEADISFDDDFAELTGTAKPQPAAFDDDLDSGVPF